MDNVWWVMPDIRVEEILLPDKWYTVHPDTFDLHGGNRFSFQENQQPHVIWGPLSSVLAVKGKRV